MLFCAVNEIPGDTSILEDVRILSEHNIRAARLLHPEPGALGDWKGGRLVPSKDYNSVKEGISLTTFLHFLFQTWDFLLCQLMRLFCLLKLLLQLNSPLLMQEPVRPQGLLYSD